MPTKAEIDQWNAAVKAFAEREGLDEELAAIKLIKQLNSDEVQDAIRTETGNRLTALECEVKELKRQVEAIEFSQSPTSQHDGGLGEPTQYIPQDPGYQPQ